MLYERNSATVYGFLARRVGGQLAEDLTAETFVKAFEGIDRFEWRGIPIRAWLLRIASNEIVARARKKSSTELVSDMVEPPAVASHEDYLVDHLAIDESVKHALTALSSQQRMAVELRFLRGLGVQEVAMVMGLGEEAVRAVTYRALKSLRARLA